MSGIEAGMQNTPVAEEPGPPRPPQATKGATIALSVALVLVVIMSGVLGTVAVLMTNNQDSPPLTQPVVTKLAVPIHFAPVEASGAAPCPAETEAVLDDAGTTCYQLEPGVTLTSAQKIETFTESDGTYSIRVVLAPDNRAQIEDLTRDTVKRLLAIVVGDKVVSTPRVAQEITQDSLSIVGGFTKEEADAFLARLKGTGAPPAQPPANQPTSDPAATGQPGVTDPNQPPGGTDPNQQPGGTNQQPSANNQGGATSQRYPTCAAAIAAAAGPYTKGIHEEYEWYIDVDNDGVACDPDDVS
ncbi:excalibur calcium-binding domain-containing protein [Herbidospora yilanensis]|uniref:excalibur calcium-binding domain-containing protein n=1 Tax=Herbidospora yilanensis TaxID=354426 RepID=UPI0009FE8F42|nr:excalibur calcium-binding domain-containing protein [Herbidospora yilanensis]